MRVDRDRGSRQGMPRYTRDSPQHLHTTRILHALPHPTFRITAVAFCICGLFVWFIVVQLQIREDLYTFVR